MAKKSATAKKAVPASEEKNLFQDNTFNHAISALRAGNHPNLADQLYHFASKGEYPAHIAKKAAEALEKNGNTGNDWLVADLKSIS